MKAWFILGLLFTSCSPRQYNEGEIKSENSSKTDVFWYTLFKESPTKDIPAWKAFEVAGTNLKEIASFINQKKPEEKLLVQDNMKYNFKYENKEITFVIIPGNAGEFIESKVFHEAMELKGEFFEQYQEKLEEREDFVYSLASLQEEKKKLSSLITLSSFQVHSKLKVNNIYLNPTLGSLETLGKIENNAKVYERRLQKIFEILPLEKKENIFFIGYSRGLPVALELASLLYQKKSTWYPQGIIGISGVWYGTPIADDLLKSNSPLYNLKNLASQLKKNIPPQDQKPAQNWQESLQKIWKEGIQTPLQNTGEWAQTVWSLSSILKTMPSYEQDIKIEDLKPHILNMKVDFLLKNMISVGFETLKLNQPISDYYKNIERFDKLVEAASQSVEELSTQKRLDWWKNHSLPQNLKFYSIAATLPSPPQKKIPSSLWKYSWFGQNTLETASLRPSSLTLAYEHQEIWNDSMVPVSRAVYWPQLHTQKHPHTWLGVLGTHHGGIVFPFVAAQKSNIQNPLPRLALLKALAAQVAY